MPITTAPRAFEASSGNILRMPELDAGRSTFLDLITEQCQCERATESEGFVSLISFLGMAWGVLSVTGLGPRDVRGSLV